MAWRDVAQVAGLVMALGCFMGAWYYQRKGDYAAATYWLVMSVSMELTFRIT